MNMLPHAIYGQRSWQEALRLALSDGEIDTLGGGEVEGRRFLVAAILGAPALWAPAREAARQGRPKLAMLRARRALRRAFTGRLRFSLDSGPREKAEALVLMCPRTSRGLDDDEQVLEAAAMDPAGAAEAFRLGVSAMLGDWRADPSVMVERCRVARVWASSGIPALLDGEPVRLSALAEVVYRPHLARVLALREGG
jgi:diacylglycerol kinase family enzyme